MTATRPLHTLQPMFLYRELVACRVLLTAAVESSTAYTETRIQFNG